MGEQMTKETTYLRIGDFTVKVEYTGHWDNDGIGWVDVWGHLTFHKGHDYFVVEDINPLFTDEGPDEIAQIVGLLSKNFDEYKESISELHEA